MMGRWFANFAYGPFYGSGMLGMGVGFLLHALFWGILIYLAVRLLRQNGIIGCQSATAAAPGSVNQVNDEAMEIVRQRYAKGEITQEQYLQLAADLYKNQNT